jgi:hypothetical protein
VFTPWDFYKPCLHRGNFYTVPTWSLNLHGQNIYTVETSTPSNHLHRVYTVSTPCLHASTEITHTSKNTSCILKSLYNNAFAIDAFWKRYICLLLITQSSCGIVESDSSFSIEIPPARSLYKSSEIIDQLEGHLIIKPLSKEKRRKC